MAISEVFVKMVVTFSAKIPISVCRDMEFSAIVQAVWFFKNRQDISTSAVSYFQGIFMQFLFLKFQILYSCCFLLIQFYIVVSFILMKTFFVQDDLSSSSAIHQWIFLQLN